MAAGAGLSPPLTVLESGYGKDNGAFVDGSNSENQEVMRQPKVGKPPRCLATIRHCVSTARLASPEDLGAISCNPDLEPYFETRAEESGCGGAYRSSHLQFLKPL